jgi:hypothetical protein
MPDAELYLVGGALLFYLLDSVLLLYGDELLFAAGLRGWHNVAAGDLLLFGRRVLVPNPLTPAAPLLRVCWSATSAGGPASDAASGRSAAAPIERALAPAFLRALRPLQWGVVALLLLVAVGLPTVLYAFGPGPPLLVLLALVYALNLYLTAWLWRVRAVLGLGARACIFLTADLLLCPPFAINLVRKITLQQEPPRDPLMFAHAQFGASQFAALCALLARRVRAELAADEPGGAHHRQLLALCQRLEELTPCPPVN